MIRTSLNPCALLLPKIGIIRHQIPKIGDMMNVLSGLILFCKITHAPNIFMIHVHRDLLGRFVLIFDFNKNRGARMGHLRFVLLFCRNNQHENSKKGMFYCITFLSFLNSDQGIPTDPKRINDILEWPTTPSIWEIWGFHGLTNFYKRFVSYFSILVAPHIELVRNHVPSWKDVQERGFHTLPYFNIPNTTDIYVFILFTGVKGRSPEFQELLDLRSNSFHGGGDDAILPPLGHWIEDSKKIELEMQEKALRFS